MLFNNVNLESLGYSLPENIVSSDDLERRLASIYDRLKLSVGRLEMMSGIKERRFYDEGVLPSDISSKAGEMAIQKSGVNRNDIGCLINASVCRDFLEPATATVIHNNLKLPQDSAVFDISNACLGVMNGMLHVANMIEMGQIKSGLVVAGENGGPLVNATIENLLSRPDVNRNEVKTAFASLTIGSAGCAVLLTHKDISRSGHKFIGGAVRAATQFNDLCRGNEDSGMGANSAPLMETDAEKLMQEGCALAKETWEIAKSNLNWDDESVDRVFTHQVGRLHRKLLFDSLNLDMNKDFPTLEFLGNTGSAALPVTFALGEEEGLIKKGDKVGLLGIGSGLNSIMLGVEW
ncbi:MAG: 3-oxoacyl-ACP synthase III [Nitrospinales bacterium]